jgi:hypothetical protein
MAMSVAVLDRTLLPTVSSTPSALMGSGRFLTAPRYQPTAATTLMPVIRTTPVLSATIPWNVDGIASNLM